MAQKRREEALILQKNEIAPGIFDVWLRVDELAKEAGPGQFLMLSCKDGSRLLPRPISICEIDGNAPCVWCSAWRAKGRRSFHRWRPGSALRLWGLWGTDSP